MGSPEIWFAIPSASPERCRRTLPAWRAMGYRTAVLQNREQASIPADVVVWTDAYPGWAASVNRICAEVVPPSADIIVTGGDDMLPHFEHDAETLGRAFHDRFPDGFGVMQPQGDPYLGAAHYCGSPWLGRAWCERMYGGRGPMHPGYHHNWADNELYWVARRLGAFWGRPDLAQHHDHVTRGDDVRPAYWLECQARDRVDVELFIARAWQGFPDHEPLGATPAAGDADFFHGAAEQAETYWLARYGHTRMTAGPVGRLRRALERCAADGHRRVAVYGAGSHTRAAGAALMDPPVDVVCLIDDDPTLDGAFLWNYPVVPVARAAGLGLDAIILSTRTVAPLLRAAATPLERHGVVIVDLDDDGVAVAPAADVSVA